MNARTALKPNRVNAVFTMARYRGVVSGFDLLARAERAALAVLWLLLAGLSLVFAQPALAQSSTTYQNVTPGDVDGTTVCATPLLRTFVVGDSFTIADIMIGHCFGWAVGLKFDFPRNGPLADYFKRLRQRPGYRAMKAKVDAAQ